MSLSYCTLSDAWKKKSPDIKFNPQKHICNNFNENLYSDKPIIENFNEQLDTFNEKDCAEALNHINKCMQCKLMIYNKFKQDNVFDSPDNKFKEILIIFVFGIILILFLNLIIK